MIPSTALALACLAGSSLAVAYSPSSSDYGVALAKRHADELDLNSHLFRRELGCGGKICDADQVCVPAKVKTTKAGSTKVLPAKCATQHGHSIKPAKSVQHKKVKNIKYVSF
ncbi:unnamed protein product [Clonostachys solani]|uniref:Uncharacterized protein n=1 Tax=Clonostachys solani TaxID=160281 RepID=A0A9P0EPW4_9HYPO|nr:unnamed protein product [Clonostachys solani]